MQIPILIEPVANNGFRARSGEPFGLSVEAATADEAVRQLRALVSAQLGAGARLLPLDVPDNPWLAGAGMFRNDPLYDAWQDQIVQRRRELDADPDVP
jgi:hypothetical protein